MNFDSCVTSDEVLEAIHSKNWPAGLRAHIEHCDSCRETNRVASWMARMAADAEAVADGLPDPELIRLKAELDRRARLPERALLLLKAGSLFGAAGLGLLLTLIPAGAWNWIQGWRAGETALTRLRDWRTGDTLVAGLQDSLSAALMIGWWIPLAAALLFLLVFTASEA